MRKIVPLCIFACLVSFAVSAQVYLENFESAVAGSGKPTSFVNNGQTFDVITATPGVNAGGLMGIYIPGNGWNMPGYGQVFNTAGGYGIGVACNTSSCAGVSDKFLDNGASNGLNQTYSIKTNNGRLFSAKSVYVYVSADKGSTPSAAGTISFIGKKAGVVVFTAVRSTVLNTNFAVNNGFNFIDFSTENGLQSAYSPIDELQFTLTGSFNYLAIDNFSYTPVYNWTGNTGTWNTAGNWDRGAVPASNMEVNISAGTPNINTNTTCLALTNNSSGNVVVNTNPLTVGAIFNNTSTLTANNTLTVVTRLRNNAGGGVVKGSGALITPNFTNFGTYSPGNSPAQVSLTGGLINSVGSTYIEELGGTSPGTGYDQLNMTANNIISGGTLDIRLINGFVPSVGQTFTIMTIAGTRSGNFAAVLWPTGVSGTITYNANNIVLTILGVLPVKLESFTGSNLGRTNQLNWRTSGEVNVKTYELQWSRDGISFTAINAQPAKGSSGVNNYNYTHSNANGTNYYRLKISDVDGKVTFSDILKFENGKLLSLNINPNPTTDNIQIELPQNKPAIAQIINSIGQVVKEVKLPSLINTVSVKELAAGIYTIKVQQGNDVKSKQIVIN